MANVLEGLCPLQISDPPVSYVHSQINDSMLSVTQIVVQRVLHETQKCVNQHHRLHFQHFVYYTEDTDKGESSTTWTSLWHKNPITALSVGNQL